MTGADILSSDGAHPDRAKVAPAGVIAAAADLATRVTGLLAEYGKRPKITSGYRTPEANKAAGGAPHSSHLEGKAVDLADPGQALSTWCAKNTTVLAKYGLWMEDPAATKTWTHLQSRPVPGTLRVFKP